MSHRLEDATTCEADGMHPTCNAAMDKKPSYHSESVFAD
jgi:hypothetical protein